MVELIILQVSVLGEFIVERLESSFSVVSWMLGCFLFSLLAIVHLSLCHLSALLLGERYVASPDSL